MELHSLQPLQLELSWGKNPHNLAEKNFHAALKRFDLIINIINDYGLKSLRRLWVGIVLKLSPIFLEHFQLLHILAPPLPYTHQTVSDLGEESPVPLSTPQLPGHSAFPLLTQSEEQCVKLL